MYDCAHAVALVRSLGLSCQTSLPTIAPRGFDHVCPVSCGLCDVGVSGAAAGVRAEGVLALEGAGGVVLGAAGVLRVAAPSGQASLHGGTVSVASSGSATTVRPPPPILES